MSMKTDDIGLAYRNRDENAQMHFGRDSATDIGDGWALLCVGRDKHDIIDGEDALGAVLWHGEEEYRRSWSERPSLSHLRNWVAKVKRDAGYARQWQQATD